MRIDLRKPDIDSVFMLVNQTCGTIQAFGRGQEVQLKPRSRCWVPMTAGRQMLTNKPSLAGWCADCARLPDVLACLVGQRLAFDVIGHLWRCRHVTPLPRRYRMGGTTPPTTDMPRGVAGGWREVREAGESNEGPGYRKRPDALSIGERNEQLKKQLDESE